MLGMTLCFRLTGKLYLLLSFNIPHFLLSFVGQNFQTFVSRLKRSVGELEDDDMTSTHRMEELRVKSLQFLR